MSGSAHVAGPYRYTLGRRWASGPPVLFVMLNPSTADAANDDPTIRRCVAFARAWGAPALEVVNLYALRATDPRELSRHDDPIGPQNDDAITAAVERARLVVAAWGANPGPQRLRPRKVAHLLAGLAWCLGRTKRGQPRHPLYVHGDTPLECWPYPQVMVRRPSW